MTRVMHTHEFFSIMYMKFNTIDKGNECAIHLWDKKETINQSTNRKELSALFFIWHKCHEEVTRLGVQVLLLAIVVARSVAYESSVVCSTSVTYAI